ncbi:MAG TPA: serine hydrolase [Ktedonobacteraceae bacterium]|jgi:D-alanyl-D-alanine carboxypeptidase (penicillin-binding protein 5/6)|nr:serine hydrolase [Ktedonobacteraceae bacterium]
MTRRTLAFILIIVAILLLLLVPVLILTPVGQDLFGGSSQAALYLTPTLLPFTPTPTPQPTPVLTVEGKPPTITATEAILMDADTGHILDDVNAERPVPMASTTKIMTALVALRAGNLNELVTIHQDAINEVILNDGSNAQLRVGDQISLKDLLYALLLPSGDDAAIAIADAVGGTTSNFVNLMNLFAYRLHLYQTHYINPDGLTYYDASGHPLPGHYTTAYDLVRLADYAMSIPLFAQIVATKHYTLPASSIHHAYNWTNTNLLLSTYTGATGIKTGYTLEAGECLVFSATRSTHHLIGVVLHSSDAVSRFNDAKLLLNWGFGLPLLPPPP